MAIPFTRLPPIDLGTFRVGSGRIVVSDPSYDLAIDAIVHSRVLEVIPGQWRAVSIQFDCQYQDSNQVHCAELIAHHVDHTPRVWNCTEWRASIDTGQAGFFDVTCFCNDDSVPADVLTRFRKTVTYDNNRLWYSYCCEMTEANEASVINGGVVSNAGYGDGAAMLYTHSGRQKQIDGLRLVFIDANGN